MVARARVREAPSRMASTVGFREVGEVLAGFFFEGWVQLSDGEFIEMAYSDGTPF